MKITKVCCQGCGADLQIQDSVRYVTCNYCHTRLEVVHDATVTHTRLLDKIEKTTEQMANNLKVIEIQNDLERLDRDWQSQSSGLMVRDKNGGISEPSQASSMIAGFLMIAAGIWIIFASSMGAPAVLFGLVFIGFAIFTIISGTTKASTFQNLRDRYEQDRRVLLSRLERERKG